MTAYAPYPPAPAPPRRTRWWLVAVCATWAVLLILLAVWSMRHEAPTVREQRTLRQAANPLHSAFRQLVRAAEPAGAIAFGPPEVTRGCRLTPVREGASAAQEVVLRVRPGTGAAAIDRIAERLPAAWDAAVRHRPDRDEHLLDADAGSFIEVVGRVEDGGAVVRLRARTGCRPEGEPLDWPGWSPAQPNPVAQGLVDALRLTSTGPPVEASVDCGGDATARTTAVEGAPAPADLAAALRDVTPAATVVQAGSGVVAYLAGPMSAVVTAADGRVRITATTGC